MPGLFFLLKWCCRFSKQSKFITIGAGFDVDQLVGGKAVWLMKTLKTAST
jgi:hypothetical protein